ncbi:hypothetical protein RRG08_042281 [Elysia crispata]|uniref:Uncharacterized protein n=1 Tax=Elysia crispata TaxID=231223 RepID=A0AAE1E056_9GAST|nr:hypothetical protein RRG08_042281 [Elysia crispata]
MSFHENFSRQITPIRSAARMRRTSVLRPLRQMCLAMVNWGQARISIRRWAKRGELGSKSTLSPIKPFIVLYFVNFPAQLTFNPTILTPVAARMSVFLPTLPATDSFLLSMLAVRNHKDTDCLISYCLCDVWFRASKHRQNVSRFNNHNRTPT